MKVFLVGSTGFVGRTTAAYLLGQGHELVAWVRNEDKARDQLGGNVRLVSQDVDLVKKWKMQMLLLIYQGSSLVELGGLLKRNLDFNTVE